MLRAVGLCACLIGLLASPSWATELRFANAVSVEAGEVIVDDLLVGGNSVLIAGEVQGDLLAVGQTVRITGPVRGSVMALGREVQIGGDVNGSVRAAGQSVTLSGRVGRNAAMAGQSLVLTDSAEIGRDFHGAAGNIDLDATVGRRVNLGGGTATVRGRIGEELFFRGEEISLGSTAVVGGNLVYRTPGAAAISPGAQIAGKTRRLPLPIKAEPKKRSPIFPAFLFLLVVFASGTVGLAAVPRLFRAAADAMANRLWWNLLLGVLTLIVVPIAALIVCFTVVGIPLAVLALVLWGAGLLFSGVPVGVFLGRWVGGGFRPSRMSPYLGLLIGLVVLTLIGFVPYLGSLTKFLTVLFGLGVYARAAKGLLVELRRHSA